MKKTNFLSSFKRAVGAVALFGAFSVSAHAAYPTKPIEILVPFPPGGTADSSARALAKGMSERLGQPVLIVNQGGAGTMIGTNTVAKSKPDGYSLLWATTPFAINHTLYPKRTYDTFKDFQPIVDVVNVPLVLTVNADTPVHNFEEFLAWAKSDNAPLTFGSSGNGGSTHLAPAMLSSMAKLDFVHVPYKGSAPSMKDLMGGQTDFIMDTAFLVAPQAKEGGRLRILAQTSKERTKLLPDVPTISEFGYEGYEVTSWFSLAAPSGVSRDIIEVLNKAANEALESKELNTLLSDQGLTVVGGSIEDAEKHLAHEVAKWEAAIKESGTTAD